MSVAENYENFGDGGVILWGSEPPEGDEPFLIKLRLPDGKYTWSTAFYSDRDGGLRWNGEAGAEIVGYCRGPDPNSNVAYQLGDPGEGTGV